MHLYKDEHEFTDEVRELRRGRQRNKERPPQQGDLARACSSQIEAVIETSDLVTMSDACV